MARLRIISAASLATSLCTLGLAIGITAPVQAQDKESSEEGHSTENEHSKGGQNNESKKRTSTGKKIRHESDDYVDADSSEVMREGKKGFVTVTLLGLSPGSVSGIDAGAFLNPNLLVAANYEISSTKFGFGGTDLLEDKEKSVSVYAKRFWGNSFYTNLGVAYRSVKHKENTISFSNTSVTVTNLSKEQSFNREDLTFALGNQWQWKNFTLGCDWFGVSYAISQQVVTNKATDTSTNQPTTADPIKKDNQIRLLALYLGASF